MDIIKFILFLMFIYINSEVYAVNYNNYSLAVTGAQPAPYTGWIWTDKPRIQINGTFTNLENPDNYTIILTNLDNNKTTTCYITEIINNKTMTCKFIPIFIIDNPRINLTITDSSQNKTVSINLKYNIRYPSEIVESMEYSAEDKTMAIYGRFFNRSYIVSVDNTLCPVIATASSYIKCNLSSTFIKDYRQSKSDLIIYDDHKILVNGTFNSNGKLYYISKVYDKDSRTYIEGYFSDLEFPIDVVEVIACNDVYHVFPKNQTLIVIEIDSVENKNCTVSVSVSNQYTYDHNYNNEDPSLLPVFGSSQELPDPPAPNYNDVEWYIWYIIGLFSMVAMIAIVGYFIRYLIKQKKKAETYGKFNDPQENYQKSSTRVV